MGGSEMINLSQRDRVLLAFLIIILLGCGFYLLIYSPINKEIQTVTNINEKLQVDKERLQAELKKAPPKTKEVAFGDLDRRLPTEDEMIPLLTMLDENFSKYNLPFTSLDFKGMEKVQGTDAQNMKFTIGTTGKLIILLDFLNDLEKAERLISIEDVSFNALKLENEKQEKIAEELGPPAYYIAPPGVPEGKLQRIRFEVVEDKEGMNETTSNSERPIAEGFNPDSFEMKVTINVYYVDLTNTAKVDNTDANDKKGEV